MNRRQLLAAAGGGIIASACAKETIPDGPDPLTGDALMHDVSIYTAFGRHRSGSSGDLATSSWFADRWTALGYEVEQTEFETPNSDTFRANITMESGQAIDGFAQPPIVMTPEGGLRGVLAEWNEAFPSNVEGRIAVVHFPHPAGAPLAVAEHRAKYRKAIDEAGKVGAIGVVAATSGPSEEIVSLNTPLDAKGTVPLLVVAGAVHPILMAQVNAQKQGMMRIEGEGGMRTAKNTVARHGKRGPWLIVSTPQSGWFQCGGERGPGVAISLALSDWVRRQGFDNRLLFIATSGHEWNDTGAHIFHEKQAPDPAETALWLHLGASFGARGYDASGDKLVPLDTPNEQRIFMVSEDLLPIVKTAFVGQPQLEDATPGSLERSAGELTLVIKEGYKSYAGFFGAHALFHTPFDDETATTPQILEPIARSLATMIEAKLRAKG